MQTNKVARGLAKRFPPLQALVGASRGERRARARAARRRSSRKKGKSRRRSSKKKRHAARASLTRERSGTINVDQLDDLARASAVHDAAQQQKGGDKSMGGRKATQFDLLEDDTKKEPWAEKTDPKSGRSYWVNRETRTSTWSNPFEQDESTRRRSRRGTLQCGDLASVRAAAASAGHDGANE